MEGTVNVTVRCDPPPPQKKVLESLQTVGLSSNSEGGGVSKSTTRKLPPDVRGLLQGFYRCITWLLQEFYWSVIGVLQGCERGVTRVVQGC